MSHQSPKQKVALIVLDGWGMYKPYPGNAIALAKTPTFDRLWQDYPSALLTTHSESVGLPEGQCGTSEVNHFTIGAGQIFFQDLVRINRAIDDESFFTNDALVGACQWAKTHGSRLHIMGLLSDGGVHSHQEHIFALLELARRERIEHVYLHMFTDGRDTRPTSSLAAVEALEAAMHENHLGKLVSLVGRYYSMDRDHNWERTDLAYDLITHGKGVATANPYEAIKASHEAGVTDEFIKPVFLGDPTADVIRSGDAVIFANFRNDRTRQLTERLLERGPKDIFFATMTQYHPLYNVEVAYRPQQVDVTLGSTIADMGWRQLRVTETEKFPHMTFFLNCKREEPYEGEDRIMLDSYSDIPTHDFKPYMRAPEVTDQIVEAFSAEKYQVIMANICNADMVGHTGNIPAAIEACETVDKALSRIEAAALEHDYAVIVIADHGNADQMIDEGTGEMHTSHTLNPAPFILVSKDKKEINRSSGTLIDIAPTICELLGIPVPDAMTGRSFL